MSISAIVIDMIYNHPVSISLVSDFTTNYN